LEQIPDVDFENLNKMIEITENLNILKMKEVFNFDDEQINLFVELNQGYLDLIRNMAIMGAQRFVSEIEILNISLNTLSLEVENLELKVSSLQG
jgi:hypothetical protein